MLDDRRLLEGFQSSTLNEFPHEFHVRVAYLLLIKYGEGEAFEHMVAGIQGLASRFGSSPSAIHITRTAAWMRIISSQVGDPMPSTEFIDTHRRLMRKDLLDDYYNWGRLLTRKSRRTFVEPDRPFPTSADDFSVMT